MDHMYNSSWIEKSWIDPLLDWSLTDIIVVLVNIFEQTWRLAKAKHTLQPLHILNSHTQTTHHG